MTKEEKQLLLKDLCARLPYGVRVKELESIKELELYLTSIYHDTVQVETMTGGRMACSVEAIKPYLRPMSSMTEEEEAEFNQIFELELKALESPEGHTIESAASAAFEIDFYNKHHIDYRGLIPMGLALEAPEGMYKNN